MKQQILATGATGLVGSRFVEMFSDRYDVINMDLTTGVDITQVSTFEPFFAKHPDAKFLIHLAAFTDTNKAALEKGDKNGICYKVNVEGTKNIAEACKTHGVHMIHVSTDFVFDGAKETPYLETDPTSPIEWYGETKAMAEDVVKASGVSYSIVRLSYPYRAIFDAKPDLVKKIRAGLESGKLYPQFTDSLITPTLIDDIARGFDQLIQTQKSGIFHFTGSSFHSPYDLACQVASAYGFDPAVVQKGSLTEYLKNSPRPFARNGHMSNAQTQAELGLTFATLEQGMEEVKKQQGL